MTASSRSNLDGSLLARLWAGFYGLWTLLPNSNSLMVGWPWVAIWQGAVLLPIGWCLWQGWQQRRSRLALGGGWDIWMAGMGVVLLISTLGAAFPLHARWYSWATLGGMATVYSLHGWLQTPETPSAQQRRWNGLVKAQGGLAIAFILLSLGWWLTQTYGPEQGYLRQVATYGVERRFDLRVLALRNWVPMGHQNYGAGYLVLNGPILVGLALTHRGWQRGLWGAGAGLGLITLLTTGSRGGLLGLGMALVVGAIALGRGWQGWRRPWIWLALGGVGAIALATQGRLVQSLLALFQGNWTTGEVAYRLITGATGWAMGAERPWTGQGLGAVPLAYQGYRPLWAGREAELTHQLHTTPMQVWAEMGIGGALVMGGAIALLFRLAYRWARSPHQGKATLLAGSLWAGLGGYGIVALTDYQLDNLAISGSLAIFLALLLRSVQSWGAMPPEASVDSPLEDLPLEDPSLDPPLDSRPPGRWQRRSIAAITALFLVGIITLIPIHRAWSLSNAGFLALKEDDIGAFTTALTQAQALVPGEPYYPLQLGWNLGELSRQEEFPPEEAAALKQQGIAALTAGVAAAPQLEFGHTSLGWLLLDDDPKAAIAHFLDAWEILPAKPGIAFGLALALLRDQQPDLAQRIWILEGLRHPRELTSPLWQQPGFASHYEDLVAQVLTQYRQWLAQPDQDPRFVAYLHQVQGFLYWWQGDFAAAEAAWTAIDYQDGLALLASGEPDFNLGAFQSSEQAPSAVLFTVAAGQSEQGEERRDRLAQAWATLPIQSSYQEAIPPVETLDVLTSTLAAATDIHDWVVNQVPPRPQRNIRLGFGMLIRHIDGPPPVDYWQQNQNLAMATVFQQVLPSGIFMPPLDTAMAPLWAAAIADIRALYP